MLDKDVLIHDYLYPSVWSPVTDTDTLNTPSEEAQAAAARLRLQLAQALDTLWTGQNILYAQSLDLPQSKEHFNFSVQAVAQGTFSEAKIDVNPQQLLSEETRNTPLSIKVMRVLAWSSSKRDAVTLHHSPLPVEEALTQEFYFPNESDELRNALSLRSLAFNQVLGRQAFQRTSQDLNASEPRVIRHFGELKHVVSALMNP